MYFTQDDYLKIQKWLSRNSVRDTEFQEADTPLRGNETVVLVQNGHNRKILISDLVDQIFTLGTTDFLNVSEFSKKYGITLEEAITLVPPKSRKEGQVISFKNEEGNWEVYQFTGEVNQWTIIDLWKPFLADIPEKSITLDHLSQEVKDAINSGGGVGEIVDGSIDTDKLANNAVTESKIANNSITKNKLHSTVVDTINSISTELNNKQNAQVTLVREGDKEAIIFDNILEVNSGTFGTTYIQDNTTINLNPSLEVSIWYLTGYENKFAPVAVTKSSSSGPSEYTVYTNSNVNYDLSEFRYEGEAIHNMYYCNNDGKYYKWDSNSRVLVDSDPPKSANSKTLTIEEALTELYIKLDLL